jgi:hypothetical protein
MSTLFYEHLRDLRGESIVKAKQKHEADMTSRLLCDVIDKIHEAKLILKTQATSLQQNVSYIFFVDISDINQTHKAFLDTLPVPSTEYYGTMEMVQGLLKRRLPEEFAGMKVEYRAHPKYLEYVVSALL